jgi:glycosyltransferase involved in cell wall biosynthesis
LSDFIQDEFEKNHGVRPQFVVPPGIDASLFDNPIHERNIDILGVGSLIRLKQYEIFVEVVAKLKSEIQGIKAILVGKGPDKERLEYLIKNFDLQDTITLTGELPYPEVLKLMQRTKVFLHPSSYEGFGCVCLEALAAGSYVISFTKPMKRNIEQWCIVKTKEEMTGKSLCILRDPKTNYESIEVFGIADTVTSIMRLFDGG